MIRAALYRVAGVDRETLETCPPTDQVWAAHLGLALIVSFTVIFGITFHATGYVIPDLWARLLCSAVVAFTVFMFDRALYQSDWFYQGVFTLPAESGWRRLWITLGRLLRITVRLSMSFGLAWVIALFLELAIFSDTITDAIKRHHVVANQPVFQKIEQFETQLANDIAERRRSVAALETLYREELAKTPAPEVNAPVAADADDREENTLNDEEKEAQAAVRTINEQIRHYAQEMNAEERGLRLSANSSGRAGTGPRYQFAKLQKEHYEAQRMEWEQQLARLHARRAELRESRLVERTAAATRREQERVAAQRRQDAVQLRQDALRGQLDRARDELNAIETARTTTVEAFRRSALAGSDFQKQKDDPLSRMTAYQELKNDPKDGATIVFFS